MNTVEKQWIENCEKIGAAINERDRLAAINAELVTALRGMVEIAELTIGWLPTPPDADGPLIQARAALEKAKP